MIFRYARHTTDLQRVEKFYTEIVGLEKLGEFKNHDNYNGLFLGFQDLNWHLEFTTSTEQPLHKFDEDDALVFYVNSEIEISEIKNRITKESIEIEEPKNPYWSKNGIMISDPDGYKIIFALRHIDLKSEDPLTNLVRLHSISTWSDLIEFTKNLPYGRNQNREDFSLLLKEGKGTCSSKHSFLKKIAELNNIGNVKLILGMYKMNHLNTPKIQTTITENGLNYLPEAHCYLKLNNTRFDFTTKNSHIKNLMNDILEEREIEPEQVNVFKVELHKKYLKNWMAENSTDMSFEEIWGIREKCIKKLEG
ncbi:MAG TPA: VOC family protein [Bacteroidia bacterium]|jgi:catechol 2,3-dioxygenase-like lactoylglutathione lyase family enzyme|nr:VOC family protein [Bacteroidia bacterium]HRG51638.1 VOC family protein [Bacteroidia bacterium]